MARRDSPCRVEPKATRVSTSNVAETRSVWSKWDTDDMIAQASRAQPVLGPAPFLRFPGLARTGRPGHRALVGSGEQVPRGSGRKAATRIGIRVGRGLDHRRFGPGC